MNERIKELAEQAGGISGNTAGREEPIVFFYESDLEKFAELIVKMCADIADEMEEIGCEYPGDAMVERFGFGTEEGAATWRTK